jgi:hypothetical protein
VGCCRVLWWEHLPAGRSRVALDLAERVADGTFIAAARDRARREAQRAVEDWVAQQDYERAAAARLARVCLEGTGAIARAFATESRGCGVLRDVFGNPFRPVAFPGHWRTPAAVAIAWGMYESRDFAALPALADALQAAGCDPEDVLAPGSEDILGHCRWPGPHVRGCWVVDLVLGRT